MRRLTITTLALALTVGATTLAAQPARGVPDRGTPNRAQAGRMAPDRGIPNRAQAGRRVPDRDQMRGATRDRAQPGRGAPDRARRARRGSVSTAAVLLRQTERLALTETQTQRLQALVQAQRSAARTSPASQLRLRADLMDAMAGDANPATVRSALDKISAAENDRIIASLRARQEALAVLTPEQQEKVKAARMQGARRGR